MVDVDSVVSRVRDKRNDGVDVHSNMRWRETDRSVAGQGWAHIDSLVHGCVPNSMPSRGLTPKRGVRGHVWMGVRCIWARETNRSVIGYGGTHIGSQMEFVSQMDMSQPPGIADGCKKTGADELLVMRYTDLPWITLI